MKILLLSLGIETISFTALLLVIITIIILLIVLTKKPSEIVLKKDGEGLISLDSFIAIMNVVSVHPVLIVDYRITGKNNRLVGKGCEDRFEAKIIGMGKENEFIIFPIHSERDSMGSIPPRLVGERVTKSKIKFSIRSWGRP